MHEETNDLIVLEEGGETNIVQTCCKSTTAAKL